MPSGITLSTSLTSVTSATVVVKPGGQACSATNVFHGWLLVTPSVLTANSLQTQNSTACTLTISGATGLAAIT